MKKFGYRVWLYAAWATIALANVCFVVELIDISLRRNWTRSGRYLFQYLSLEKKVSMAKTPCDHLSRSNRNPAPGRNSGKRTGNLPDERTTRATEA
ncbi:MAG: hypothetical protein Q7R83_00600 [bacterium]|nr:hypothetical protein [bacterium]